MTTERPERSSVLLVRLLAFGDVLLTLPIVEALARSSRVAYVDLLTASEFAEDALRSPYVRRVFSFDTRTGRVEPAVEETGYDLIADLHTRGVPLDPRAEHQLSLLSGRTRVGYASPHAPPTGYHNLPPRQRTEHAVEYYARSVAPLLDAPLGDGRLAISDAERREVARDLPPRTVCLAPGARYPWKRWPATSYARLADRLVLDGMAPVLVGHPFDRSTVEDVLDRCPPGVTAVVAGTGRLAATMAASGVVVANNSGLTALASAAGAQVVCLHSHTLPAMWRPWGTGHADLVGDGEAMPCACSGAAPQDLATPCGKGIPVDDVVAAVHRLSGTLVSARRGEPAWDGGIDRVDRS
jgi:heptosyltransferase-2